MPLTDGCLFGERKVLRSESLKFKKRFDSHKDSVNLLLCLLSLRNVPNYLMGYFGNVSNIIHADSGELLLLLIGLECGQDLGDFGRVHPAKGLDDFVFIGHTGFQFRLPVSGELGCDLLISIVELISLGVGRLQTVSDCRTIHYHQLGIEDFFNHILSDDVNDLSEVVSFHD